MKNKEETTQWILSLVKDQIKKCTKNATDTIVFPKWSELGLWGKMFPMRARTKEQPEGCDYNENKEHIVIRILDGKLMIGGVPDVYTLEQNKVEDWMKDESTKIIGTNSKIAKKNTQKVLNLIKSKEEQKLLADMFRLIHADFYMIKVPPQERYYVEITQELYDAGLTYCVNSWVKPNKNGNAKELKLKVGDFLICKPKENGEGFRSVYRIGRDEFLATHTIKD